MSINQGPALSPSVALMPVGRGQLNSYRHPLPSTPVADDIAPRDSWVLDNLGMGGQGVLPVPNVYIGWVQKLPDSFKLQLTLAQRNPFPIP